MAHLIGGGGTVGWVAAKALLLYLTAVAGFRLGERRTLAEMSGFDFAAAVAVGAIVGRVPNASDASYVAGTVTLVTVLAAHRIITRLRRFPAVAQLVDHPPRLLVAQGRVLEGELRRSGLTHADLAALLRQQGLDDLARAQFVIFEQRGQVSVVPWPDRDGEPRGLIRSIAERASVQP